MKKKAEQCSPFSFTQQSNGGRRKANNELAVVIISSRY